MPKQPVTVTGGQIQGLQSPIDPSITIYKGIPYAAPPVAGNRFKPPFPVVPWEGVKLCDTIGPVCPQAPPDPRYPDMLKGHPQSEDCLYLNVYAPSDAAEQEKPYPVFVWYHGGGFREGGSADPNFDGTGLAQKGVIVVVPSFRLSVFGYFAHPELTAEGIPGNVGMLDAIQVLKWIQSNITAFSGDPNRVTVAGQSAGSAMAHTLLVSPLAKGLVHGAVLQSGSGRTFQEPSVANGPMSYRPLKQAEDEGVALLQELGLKNVEELRGYNDIDKLLQISLRRDHQLWGPPPFWRLILDGHVIPKPWNEIFEDEPANDVPVMTGMNSEEGGTYNEPRFTYDDFVECVESRFGPHSTYSKGDPKWVKQFNELYVPADKETGKGPLQAWNDASRDNTRNNTSLWAQEYHKRTKSPVYGYYFTHAITPWHNFKPDYYSKPKVPGFTNMKGPIGGAYHGAEFAFVFNSLITNDIRPWTETDRLVGDRVSTLWANFVKYGNPNGPEGGENKRPEGVEEWPNLIEHPDTVLELGTTWKNIKTVADPKKKEFWDAFVHSQKKW